MLQIKGKKLEKLERLSIDNYERVIVDLGCGDGKQVFRQAKSEPENFFLGIDSSDELMKETSQKALKKPEKGGAPNLIFLKESAENLSNELANIADEVQINFPWGSLLEGVVLAEEQVIKEVAKILKNNGILKIWTTYNDKFEKNFRQKRELPNLTLEYIQKKLLSLYKNFNLEILNSKLLDEKEKKEILSPWGKKILSKRDREVFYIEAKLNTP